MIRLQIISGSDRPNANALRVSKYLKRKYEFLEDQQIEVGIINLQEFPTAAVQGGKYGIKTPYEVKKFIQPLLDADGLVVVCPEYNGGYPGILKLFIDYLPFPESLDKKPVAFVGEAKGAFGAMRAVEQMQQVVGYRNAYVFPERVFISRIDQNFDDEKGLRDDFQQQLLESQITNFAGFVEKLSQQVV